MWNFFRLENEHLNNCGEFRAVRDISVAPLNADDQTLLEQMMDQEDGVRNRQKNRPWKYSQSISLRRPRLASQYVWLPLLWDEFPSGLSLEKKIVLLPWEIRWTEEPGKLQSMGSQKSLDLI